VVLNTRRESGMLFKENGSKCRRGDLENIIFLFVISDVAGKLKCFKENEKKVE